MAKRQYVALTRDEGNSYVVLVGDPGENEAAVFSRAAEKILPRDQRSGDIWQQTQLANLRALPISFVRKHYKTALEAFELDQLDATGVNTAALGL